MKYALKCAKCRNIYMPEDVDITLMLDFYEQKITFYCPSCKHENILDFGTYKKKQEHSPLPLLRTL